MGAAALRIMLLAVLVVCGALSSTAVAGDEIDPIGTITAVISTIASQTTIASDLTGRPQSHLTRPAATARHPA